MYLNHYILILDENISQKDLVNQEKWDTDMQFGLPVLRQIVTTAMSHAKMSFAISIKCENGPFSLFRTQGNSIAQVVWKQALYILSLLKFSGVFIAATLHKIRFVSPRYCFR